MTNNKTRKQLRKSLTDKVYSKNDYNSNDGMLTTVWGPGMWHYLHTMSFNYPVNPTPEDKEHYMKFILNLKYVLPCGKCRKNLRKNLKRLPLTMSHMQSRETFSKYVYHLHELINKMLGKTSGLSYADVRERYEHFRARCAQPVNNLLFKCMNNTRKRCKKIEAGCTEPLYGEKAKCILKIIPHDEKVETLQIDTKCIKKKLL
jgi:hypothetical protein